MPKKSLEAFYKDFMKKVQAGPPDQCWEWTGYRDHRGYGQFGNRSSGRPFRAPRIAYQMHFGEIPKGLFVCHKCDNPPCVNPAHLFLGDAKTNNGDRRKRLRGPRGEQHIFSKLTEKEVKFIKKHHKFRDKKYSQKALAEKFGVLRNTIADIIKNKTWRHI